MCRDMVYVSSCGRALPLSYWLLVAKNKKMGYVSKLTASIRQQQRRLGADAIVRSHGRATGQRESHGRTPTDPIIPDLPLLRASLATTPRSRGARYLDRSCRVASLQGVGQQPKRRPHTAFGYI